MLIVHVRVFFDCGGGGLGVSRGLVTRAQWRRYDPDLSGTITSAELTREFEACLLYVALSHPKQYGGIQSHFPLSRLAALLVSRLDHNAAPGIQRAEWKQYPTAALEVVQHLLEQWQQLKTGAGDSAAGLSAEALAEQQSVARRKGYTPELRATVTKELSYLPELLWMRVATEGQELVGFKQLGLLMSDLCKPNVDR
jgi:hypothetical protein